MKHWFHRGDLSFACLSLIVALAAWFITNISQTYHEYVAVPVRVHCNGLDGFAQSSSNAPRVGARCSARGYQMMKLRRRSGGNPVDIAVAAGDLRFKGGNTWYMTPKDFENYIPEMYFDGTTVNMFAFDTIFFTFATELYKKVPVDVFLDVTCDPQYTIVKPVRVKPDSVVVYGDQVHLEDLEYVSTVPVHGSGLHSSIHGVAKLRQNRNLRYSTETVMYDADVVRYVEVTRTLPVEVRNTPRRKNCIALPSNVDVSLRCRFPLDRDPFQGLRCYVDYDDFLSSRQGYCPVMLDGLGDWTVSCEISPDFAEIIVMDSRY